MLVYYFVPFIVSNRYLLFWVSDGHNSVTVQNRTHVYMNIFDHKDLGNHFLQLCPKVVKHPVCVCVCVSVSVCVSVWTINFETWEIAHSRLFFSRQNQNSFEGTKEIKRTSVHDFRPSYRKIGICISQSRKQKYYAVHCDIKKHEAIKIRTSILDTRLTFNVGPMHYTDS